MGAMGWIVHFVNLTLGYFPGSSSAITEQILILKVLFVMTRQEKVYLCEIDFVRDGSSCWPDQV